MALPLGFLFRVKADGGTLLVELAKTVVLTPFSHLSGSFRHLRRARLLLLGKGNGTDLAGLQGKDANDKKAPEPQLTIPLVAKMGLTIVGSKPVVAAPVVVVKPTVVAPVAPTVTKAKDPTIKRHVVPVKVSSVSSQARSKTSLTAFARKNLCSKWKVACREEAAKIPHGFLFRCKPIPASSEFSSLLFGRRS